MRVRLAATILGCACGVALHAPVAGQVESSEPAELSRYGAVLSFDEAVGELLPWLDAHPGARVASARTDVAEAALVSADTSVVCIDVAARSELVPSIAPGDHCLAVSPAASTVQLLVRAGSEEEATGVELFVRLDDQTFRLDAAGLSRARVGSGEDDHWSGTGPSGSGGRRFRLAPVERPADVPWAAIETLDVFPEGDCLAGDGLLACPVGGAFRAADPWWIERVGSREAIHVFDAGVVVESEPCGDGYADGCARLVHVLGVEDDRLRLEGSILVAEERRTHMVEATWEPDPGLAVFGSRDALRWSHRVLGPRCVSFDAVTLDRGTYERFRPDGGAWAYRTREEIPSLVVLVEGPSALPREPSRVPPDYRAGEETPLAPDRPDVAFGDEPIPEDVEVFDRRGIWELRGEIWERVDACST